MTEKDKERIDEAYSTTYRSTIKRLMMEADTEECREALHHMLCDPDMEWED